VRTEELTQGRVTNVASGLSGKVSGLDIRLTDNGVNPQVKINLRGNRSLTGNNSALVILDGVPVNQQYVATLNPNDIENVTVLKGANAAALYGIEASNGVLIITTRKGGRSKLSVNYKNTTLLERVSYMPDLQSQYSPNGGETGSPAPIGAYPYRSYWDPTTGKLLPVPFENQNYGSAYNSLDYPLSRIAVGGPLADGTIIYDDFKGYKDSKSSFFQTGTTVQNDLSAQLGNSIGGLYFSGQRVDTRGVVPEDKYNRTSGRVNGNVTLGKFSAVGTVNYSVSNTDIVGNDQIQGRQVYWNVINQPAHIRLGDDKWKNVDDPNSPGNLNNYINAYYQNPWWQVYHSRRKSQTKAITSSLTLSYKLLDWLTVTGRTGYSRSKTENPTYIDSIRYAAYAIADPFNAGNTPSSNIQRLYQNELVNSTNDDWNNDAYLTIRKKVGPITATLIGGGNYRARNTDADIYNNEAYPANLITLPTRVRDSIRGGGFATLGYKRRDFGAYGDLTLGYDDWLFVHGSFRNDWVSVLDRDQRSFNYPGVDVSAVLHDKIDFLKNSQYISFLKVRAGYSLSGNVSFPQTAFIGVLGGFNIPRNGAYYIFPTLNNSTGFPFNGLQSYTQNDLTVQSGLRPEKTRSIEIGTEIGFLRDRIRIEAVYFKQNTTDQTLAANVARSSGTSQSLVNTGEMQNTGYEIDLRFSPLARRGKFNWNLGFNFSHIDNKVI
ncbi:MAG: TonB-dependent receptor, partial [Sphingobacteriaceae bacterium]